MRVEGSDIRVLDIRVEAEDSDIRVGDSDTRSAVCASSNAPSGDLREVLPAACRIATLTVILCILSDIICYVILYPLLSPQIVLALPILGS